MAVIGGDDGDGDGDVGGDNDIDNSHTGNDVGDGGGGGDCYGVPGVLRPCVSCFLHITSCNLSLSLAGAFYRLADYIVIRCANS
jgi:hypothetical protein